MSMAAFATPSRRSSATTARWCRPCTRSVPMAAAQSCRTAKATGSRSTRHAMPEGGVRRWQRAALVALCLVLAACQSGLVHEVQSPYSHIRVYDADGRRAIYFGGDEGTRVVETLMDLRQPHVLQHVYSHVAMAGFLYRPRPTACLLVGLG